MIEEMFNFFWEVLVQMHNGKSRRESVRLHYGRRDGAWENATMHRSVMDLDQAIASCWKPSIEKCIIACPSSLVKNWANELGKHACRVFAISSMSLPIVKWLGQDTINVLAVDGKGW